MKANDIFNGTSREDLNVKAFLAMIRKCEHGGKDNSDIYRTRYGGVILTGWDFSDHPYYTGIWKGETLSPTMCKNAGLGAGCKSTAFGAYQYIKSTWRAKALKLGLPDMSPKSQDLAAIDDLRAFGLLELIQAGKIVEALKSEKLGQQWASLPTAKTKQNPKSQATAIAYYQASGGNVA